MGIELILLITGILSAVVTAAGVAANAVSVDQTNEANLSNVNKTNAANVQQAELAYRRSLPTQQLHDMMAAGISRPAALQKIAGGGTYQMPTLQAGSSQAKQFDLSGIAGAVERLGGIPAATQQKNIQDTQLESLKQEIELRREAALREEEQHKFDMWQKLYGKDATMSIDALSNEIVQMAADRGISLDNVESIDQLRKLFDLDNNKIWRTMPNMARTQVIDAVRSQAAENRAKVAANDAHDLSNYRKAIEKINVKYYEREKHEQLLNLMRDGQNLIQEGRIKYQDATAKELENFVRESGIDSEREANALRQYVRKLQEDDALDVAEKAAGYPYWMKQGRAGIRLFLQDLGEVLSKVKLGQ